MALFRRFQYAIPVALVFLLLTLAFMATSSSLANDAEREDLAVIAAEEDISVDEAVLKYGWRNDLSNVVWDIGEAYPDDLSESRKPSGDTAWVGFAGEVPDGARDMIRAFTDAFPHVTVELRANMGFSKKERIEATELAHYAVYEHEGVEDAGTRFDLETKTIQVSAKLSDSNAPSLNSLKSLAEARLVSDIRSNILDVFSVSVDSNRNASKLDLASDHRGGEELTPYCTSAFVGEDANGNRGVLTAAHCGSGTLNDDAIQLLYDDLYDHEGPNGDVQWRTPVSSYPLPNRFYRGTPSELERYGIDVTSVGHPDVNDYLCQNGKIGFKDCQLVHDDRDCDGPICGLAVLVGNTRSPGDSGGPVYNGSEAHGIHHGRQDDNGTIRDMFTRADRIFDAIEIYVSTSPE